MIFDEQAGSDDHKIRVLENSSQVCVELVENSVLGVSQGACEDVPFRSVVMARTAEVGESRVVFGLTAAEVGSLVISDDSGLSTTVTPVALSGGEQEVSVFWAVLERALTSPVLTINATGLGSTTLVTHVS